MSGYKQWDEIYSQKLDLVCGPDITYCKGYEWLKDCPLIEDWGCGYGVFEQFCRAGQYKGIDGSCTPHAATYVDLCKYRSNVPGIFMRHVLEHNDEWVVILRNAVASFQQRMVLVLFTPFVEQTYDKYPPDMSKWRHYFFARSDIIREFVGVRWQSEENIPTNTQFGVEHVFYLRKGPDPEEVAATLKS
jgi:hypothetical protein